MNNSINNFKKSLLLLLGLALLLFYISAVTAYCGDGVASTGEECDGTDFGGKQCSDMTGSYTVPIPGGSSTIYGHFASGTLKCTSSCTFDTSGCSMAGLGSCGDGICDPNAMAKSYPFVSDPETIKTCFKDCFKDGWTTNDDGWLLGVGAYDGYLAVNNSNVTTVAVMYSDPLDIKVNVSYMLSADFIAPTGYLAISLDSNCTNSTGYNTDCGFGTINISNIQGSGFQSKTFNIVNNRHSTNEIYFKNVRLKIEYRSEKTASNILDYVTNISLKEVPNPVIHYDSLPPDASMTTGCCPSNYCWNGSTCMDSNLWMSNASYQGIWNNLLISNWANNHINSTNQPQATSYRCVIVNNDTNEAQWVPSQIKYDWNYEQSGYCAVATDCFVNNSIILSSLTPSIPLVNYSKGCIHSGDIVSDKPYNLDQGNHYCYMGNWTTKSYIVATLLQNISKNSNYVLQCYDDKSLTYNLNQGDADSLGNVLSTCVLIMKTSSDTEQVITGVVLNDNPSSFLTTLVGEYNKMYNIDITSAPGYASGYTPDCVTDQAQLISGTNFAKCIDIDINLKKLKVYYETHYKFFVMSDDTITEIEKPTFFAQIWEDISNFFKNLFSTPIVSVGFTSTNYTTNYDRIYVVRNGTLNVTGIEESKYDEMEQRVVDVLYIHYVGSNNSNNPINAASLFKTINSSLNPGDILNLTCNGCLETPNSLNYQDLIIKTDVRTGLWSYFTSSLRIK